ncbi:MAG: hypothetical protein K2G04_08680, partial [Oscillospiraceae bacterium]|nr:hypothetical protein [Oscillospiraceae bacterium]
IMGTLIIVLVGLICLRLSVKVNENVAETGVFVSESENYYQLVDKSVEHDKSEIILNIENSNRISEILCGLNWINSADVNIALDNSSLTIVLDIERNPSEKEIDDILEIILQNLNGIGNDNIFITDRNNNVIYSLYE